MAAVALAWESQSTRRVGCSAVARQAARFTAVVVLLTPPLWFATAMIRAKYSPESENLAKSSQGCKMFHVEQRFDSGNQALEDELFHVEHRLTTSLQTFATLPRMFHVEQSMILARAANGCESGNFSKK